MARISKPGLDYFPLDVNFLLVGGKLEFQFETFSNERSRAICFNCSFHQERQKEENPRSIFYAFHLTTHSVHHESGRI